MLIDTLTEEESRALGTLLEKSLATPDYYPMTLNALRNACNQKSSRDPVTEYGEDTLSLALSGLKRKCLVTFIPYGSQGTQFKYRHFLEDVRFGLEPADLAVLAVLLLRGSQTLNEIRMRASALHGLDSPEAAEAVLKNLADRAEPLAELLPKRPGWKEPRWRDKLRVHDESRAGGLTPGSGASADGEMAAPGSAQPGNRSKWDEFEELRMEVAALRRDYAELKAALEKMKEDLGA